jgi:hypothetical protein
MSTIIDTSYFYGDLNISNIKAGKPSGDNLNIHIERGESEFLTEILGFNLYTLFKAELPVPVTKPFKDLLFGIDFTDSLGRENHWAGFEGNIIVGDNGEEYKFSPIANYVYWRRMRQKSIQNTGVGPGIPKAENVKRTGPTPEMLRAWNQMVEWNWIMHDFIRQNKDDYPTYIGFKFPPYRIRPNGVRPLGNQRLFIRQPKVIY